MAIKCHLQPSLLGVVLWACLERWAPNSCWVRHPEGCTEQPPIGYGSVSQQLHVFANGQDVGTPWSNLPTDTPLYGVVGLENDGVYGKFELGKHL